MPSDKEVIYEVICPICGKEIVFGKDKWVWLIFYYHLECFSGGKNNAKENNNH